MRNVQGTIAGTLGLTGFAVAMVSSFASGASASASLTHALLALPACYLVGMAIAASASVAIDAHVQRITSGNPIPDTAAELARIDRDGLLREALS